MKAKAGDLIRIKDQNMLSLYYSVQKITRIEEHPISKRNGYIFKLNEQEFWIDSDQSQVLVSDDEKTTEVEKMVSLRVIVDTISTMIRNFGFSDEAFDYISQLCADSNSLDSDYQKILMDYQSGNPIDKIQLTTVASGYYDVLKNIEMILSKPEVTKNVFTKLVDSLQKTKCDYINSVEPAICPEPIQVDPPFVIEPNIQNELSNEPISIESPLDQSMKDQALTPQSTELEPGENNSEDVNDNSDNIDLENDDSSNNNDEDENSENEEDIEEKLNFLRLMLNEEGINKELINFEIKILESKLNEENIWNDAITLILPSLMSTIGVVNAIAQSKNEALDETFTPSESQAVLENSKEIYNRFKEFLNQSNDQSLPKWNEVDSNEFQKILEERKSLPEIQIKQIIDLFNFLKEHEA